MLLVLAFATSAYAIPGAIGFAIYTFSPNAQITVHNSSTAVLTNVRVSLASQLIWTGDLQPGETHKIVERAGGEGLVDLTFEARGRAMSYSCCYVSSPPIGGPVDFLILPTLEVEATNDGRPLGRLPNDR